MFVLLRLARNSGFTCGGNPPNEMFLIARLRTGDIYQWGLHPWKSANGIVPSPVRVDFGVSVLVKVKAVACGVSHCMVVSDDGRVCNIHFYVVMRLYSILP